MSSLIELIRNAVAENSLQAYTGLPATIVSYSRGRAVVRPDITITGSEPLPDIHDVPVQFPMSSTGGIVFEVSKGDKVWLQFSSQSLDQWCNGGSEDIDGRRNDLADAVAIPCLFPFADAPTLKADEGCRIEYKSTTITIKKNGDVEIGGSSAKALVQESFLTAFSTHTHLFPATNGAPTTPAMVNGVPVTPIQIEGWKTQKTTAE